MEQRHLMAVESQSEAGIVLVCPEPGCGRQIVITTAGRLTVIQTGDFRARHSGGSTGARLDLRVQA